jgi:poly-gamma-glutamate capsule biosynthesis protein CapA/YwtB (metallophosphatase superfamily)
LNDVPTKKALTYGIGNEEEGVPNTDDGCGDFVNHYEGISGYEEFRGDLALMYFVTVEPGSGRLRRLAMVPLQTKRFSVHRASRDDAAWLHHILNQEGAGLGTQVANHHRDMLLLS